MESIKLQASYKGDSKRFHKFLIDDGQDLVGSIYCPKNSEVPKSVQIELKSNGSKKSGKED